MAVDGSANSDRALDLALDLAEKFNAFITILNVSESLVVTEIPRESIAYSGGNAAAFGNDIRKIHEEILSRSVARAKAVKPNLPVSSMLKEGDPAYEIVNTAKEGSFDIIVIGHRGLGRMQELILGSTSEKVANLTPVPLVIVR